MNAEATNVLAVFNDFPQVVAVVIKSRGLRTIYRRRSDSVAVAEKARRGRGEWVLGFDSDGHRLR